ncbi:MAG: HmuY family protein [Janthinobacterium lividum]
MSNLTTRVALSALTLAALNLTACKDDNNDVTPTPGATTAITMTNLAPGAVTPVALAPKAVTSLTPQPSGTSSTGAPTLARHYTFYSFETGAEVPYTDSASTKWDVAFRSTTILVNGGASGPGQGQAQVAVGTTYAAQATAPTTGYTSDAAIAKAIPTGSGNGWYNYSSTTNVITPIAGRVILLKTATGKYAKMEVTNYYKNAPASPTSADPSGYYSFRYSIQTDGTTALNATTASSGQPLPPAHYTFYSLATQAPVPYTDSASTKWDVAFNGTTILVNGGTSGPGQGQAQVVATLFEDLTTAPPTGYKADAATGKAIPTGSGNGWYTYDSNTHLISATPGRIIALKTATGKYAKMEIKSYYKDAPAAPTTSTLSGYYNFRYIYQADGSTNLK